MYNQLQAGFLTCVLPRSSFPSGRIFCRGQWIIASRISDLLIGAGAHSGATAADFNRVPVSVSQSKMPRDLQLKYPIFKELYLDRINKKIL